MKDKKDFSSGISIGMCLGLAIGTAIGAATHNIGLWMPVGLALGLAFGAFTGRKNTDGEEKENSGDNAGSEEGADHEENEK